MAERLRPLDARARRLPPGAPLALGVAAAVAALVLPLPSPLLDLLLSAQLAAGVVVLWIAATAPAPSRLTGLPVALLAATLARLALNVATTRAILSRGEAGRVVEAFGDAMAGGELLVGVAVFAVVTLAQYVVVARGAGRVAEVAARFALDALPGRQQAIEAELRAGLLDPEGARQRRDGLDRISGLYGAMDGVMRFVRGDAVAGLCIVGVNIVGGLLIGLRRGLGLGEALSTYTVLTVGDGLVSQVPAVLSTAAAAVLATRLASPERPDAVAGGPPLVPALGGAAVLFVALALAPGLPGWPLAVVAGGLALGAWGIARRATPTAVEQLPAEARTVSPLALALHPAAFEALGGRTGPAIDRARRTLVEFGVRLPTVAVDPGAVDVTPSGYRIEVGGAPMARGLAMAGRVFVCPCPAGRPGLDGLHPEHDAPGRWVERGAGIDPVACVAAHLAAVWRRQPAALPLQALAERIERIERHQPALVRAVVPKRMSLEDLAVILRRLLAEDVPVADLPRILEALAAQPVDLDPPRRLARLRRALRPWLVRRRVGGRWLPVICVADRIERAAVAGAVGGDLHRALVEAVDRLRSAHPRAALLVADDARRALRDLLAEQRPGLPVLGHGELDPALTTQVVGLIDPDE